MTNAAVARGFKLVPFVASWHDGPLPNLLDGDGVNPKRRCISLFHRDYGGSVRGEMLDDCCLQDSTSFESTLFKHRFHVPHEFFLSSPFFIFLVAVVCSNCCSRKGREPLDM